MSIENYEEHRPQLRIRNNIEIVSDGTVDRNAAAVVGPCKARFNIDNYSSYMNPLPDEDISTSENVQDYIELSDAILKCFISESDLAIVDSNGAIVDSQYGTITAKKDTNTGNITFTYKAVNNTSDYTGPFYIAVPELIEIDYNNFGNEEYKKSFKSLKVINSSTSILKYFGPTDPSKNWDDEDQNKLAIACNLMLEAGNGDAFYADTCASSGSDKFSKSITKLSHTDKIMQLAFLTDDINDMRKLKEHVLTCSGESTQKWRGGFVAASGDASNAKLIAKSMGSSLITCVWAPGATYATTDSSGNIINKSLPSYYIAAGIAALTASVLPQQGISRMELPWISGVVDTYTEYEIEDLNDVASNGVMIICQDDEEVVPYIRHQLTTDVDHGVMYYEQSIRVNTQSVNYIIKDAFQDYHGKKNITEKILSNMQIKAKNTLDELTYTRDTIAEENCGPQLVSVDNVSVSRDSTFADRVNITATVGMAVPMNVVQVTINTVVGY